MSAANWATPDPLMSDEELIAQMRRHTWRVAKENRYASEEQQFASMRDPHLVLASRCSELVADLIVATWAAATEGAEVGDMTRARSRLVAMLDQIRQATPRKSELTVERSYRELLDIARQIDHDGEVDDGILDSLHRVLANL